MQGSAVPKTAGQQPVEPVMADDEQSGGTVAVAVDAIWAATGMAPSAMEDPLLAQLQQAAPTRVVGGYCVVADDTLVWPGVGLHLLGRCASLSLGPTAGQGQRSKQAHASYAGALSLWCMAVA